MQLSLAATNICMHDQEPINFINIIITANIWYYTGMIYMWANQQTEANQCSRWDCGLDGEHMVSFPSKAGMLG